MPVEVPSLQLNDGISIPQLGFGVLQIQPGDAVDAVSTALANGYRLIDTAAAYRNEREVGLAIQKSGIARDNIFLTTKVGNNDQGYDQTLRAARRSAELLGVDFIDLYLIHWPIPSADRYLDTWRAMIQLRQEGLLRSIGVSNFLPEHIERLVSETGVTPAVNQIELHPYLSQPALSAYDAEHQICTEAWSPLGRGGPVLQEETLIKISQSHGRTPAQVILRWHLQQGFVVIPRSVTPSRIAENIGVFDFELAEDEMTEISRLDRGGRIGNDPATFAGNPGRYHGHEW